ncbi:MAG: hypothetical protein ABI899_04175 [Actinomycetota bacterium]
MNSWNAMTYDTTESYFVAFDAARSHGEVPPAYGPPGMATRVDVDPASFVLTAYGRYNAGTVRGDADTADRHLSSFFRI